MFFCISPTETDRFQYHYRLTEHHVLGVDAGWTHLLCSEGAVYFKGYSSDTLSLNQIALNLYDHPEQSYPGNFCVIIVHRDTVTVAHDSCRGFPLWHNTDTVTNLESLSQPVWADHAVTITHGVIRVQARSTPTENYTLTYTDTLNRVHDIICTTFENFLSHNTLPLKIFVSGGIDTIMCLSYLKKFTTQFELLDYEYKKFTYFYKKNWHDRLRNFWAYRQIHSWGNEPVALVSGSMGDEYFMRGPSTANLFLLGVHQTNINEILPGHEDEYMFEYLSKDDTQKIFHEQTSSKLYTTITSSKKNTIRHIEHNLANDHQHWHLDKTITFTPWKNITIPKLLMNLSLSDYKKQILNAEFNKDLIARNDPNDLKLLSKFKNKNSFENLI